MSENILKITDADYQDKVINSEKPILVDYWAEWCGPCKMIAPILEEVANELSDKIIIGKMNVDENPQTPPTLAQPVMKIMRIPVINPFICFLPC